MTTDTHQCCSARIISVAATTNSAPARLCSPFRKLLATGFLCLILMGVMLTAPAQATPIITNSPPPLESTGLVPPEIAIADTATIVSESNFAGVLQMTLNAQGFTAANNWTLNVIPLGNDTNFTIEDYSLFLNPAGTAFGEEMDFTMLPNLAPPNVLPGSVVTEHWLQILNEDQPYGGFGNGIVPLQGYWQADNGDKNGGKAAGATTGPYYDSNSGGKNFSTPPSFHDAPQFYAGVGTYLHFDTFPVWDVFTPATGAETMDVGDYGMAWGFQIVGVPEPSTGVFMVVGLVLIGVSGRARFARRRRAS
jgi:hypothetical protein